MVGEQHTSDPHLLAQVEHCLLIGADIRADLFPFDEFGRLMFATSKRFDDLCTLDILGEGLAKGPPSESEREICVSFFFF